MSLSCSRKLCAGNSSISFVFKVKKLLIFFRHEESDNKTTESQKSWKTGRRLALTIVFYLTCLIKQTSVVEVFVKWLMVYQDSTVTADEDALSPLVLQGSLTAEEEAELMNHYQYTGATTNIHSLLSSLVNYAQPVKFQGFDVAEGISFLWALLGGPIFIVSVFLNVDYGYYPVLCCQLV